MDAIFDGEMPRARLAVLLGHFSQIDDDRKLWRVVYSLAEVLLLLTCVIVASCDDFEDIVEWGEHHLDFLRRFSAFHFGVVRWLQTPVNRIDPVLFGRCFDGMMPTTTFVALAQAWTENAIVAIGQARKPFRAFLRRRLISLSQ